MKNNGRKWGWILLAVIVITGLLFPGGKVYAEGTLNLTITSDYILSWEDYPGAAVYYLEIDGGSERCDKHPAGHERCDIKDQRNV